MTARPGGGAEGRLGMDCEGVVRFFAIAAGWWIMAKLMGVIRRYEAEDEVGPRPTPPPPPPRAPGGGR